MKFNENLEYYVVKGWFENNNGLKDKTFYGAVVDPHQSFQPKHVILHGDEAVKAADAAAKQNSKVYPEEIFEMVDTGGIASTTNTALFGMPDRGGHGHTDNLRRGGKTDDSKKVKTGRNIKGSGSKPSKKSKDTLDGFGSKFNLPTISQSGGKRGGNY